MAQGSRPLGVTIVGVLYILLAILFILAGLGLIAVAGLSGIDFTDEFGDIDQSIIMILGVVVLLVGFFYLLIGVGCLKGWGWVWTLAVVFTIIGLILTLVQAVLAEAIDIISVGISVLISLLILWYLFRQNVKAWFGKA